MKSKSIAAVFLGALLSLLVPAVAAAQDGDVFSCPTGTTFDYKIEPLSGVTFTVPAAPTGWTITGVVLKVGGPGGGSHITFTPVIPGQVLSVAYQQFDISHAHICKSDQPPETTLPEETTTSTTTTTPPTSTSPTTTQPTDTTTTSPTTSTSVPPSSSSPSSSSQPSSSSSVPSALSSTTDPGCVMGGADNPNSLPECELPPTGADTSWVIVALALIALGAGALAATRRKNA